MKNPATHLHLFQRKHIILLIAFAFILPGKALTQDCICLYYEVRHFNRLESHPVFGDWHILKTYCVPPDNGKDVKVTADGMTASKFEVTLRTNSGCEHLRTDPRVEFVNDNFEPIQNPTPEEHGVIEVISMTSTSVYFEYTHPTDLPENGDKFRKVMIMINDSSHVTESYTGFGYIVVNVYRPPILMVHGLFSDTSGFQVMRDVLVGSLYDDPMVILANYDETHGSSFATNADVVPAGINAVITSCRNSYFSAGKVILMGHSMGGILSRLYLQNAYRDDVYRLITFNTPHAGSQVANFLFSGALNHISPGMMEFGHAWTGAIEDLQVGSPAIDAMNTGTHPGEVGVHAVITTKEHPLLPFYNGTIVSWSELYIKLISISTDCLGQMVDSIFDGDAHDLVVTQASQGGGLSVIQSTTILDQMHVGSTNNPAVLNIARELLDEPITSDMFTTAGFNPPNITYNPDFNCNPFLQGKETLQHRASDVLTFVGAAPGDSVWITSDSIQIIVSGPGVDTIMLVMQTGTETFFVQTLPGPEATFNIEIPEGLQGNAPIVVFGYTATEGIIGFLADTVEIEPAYRLTGISVGPAKVWKDVGDTTDLLIIGHYDDGIDRSLKGNPALSYQFTTWTASRTSAGNIMLDYAENDTLIIHIDTFQSAMVKIIWDPFPFASWTGGTGTWDEDDKWDIGCPPGPTHTVSISSGECTIPAHISAQAKTIQLTGASLSIDGALALSGSTGIALHINKGTVENDGTLTIQNSGDAAIVMQGTSSDSALFINRGDIAAQVCTGTYGVYISTNTKFLNEATGDIALLDCGNSESLEIISGSATSFENKGTLSIDGGPIGGVGRILNSGTLILHHTEPELHVGLGAAWLKNTSSGIMYFENILHTAILMTFSTDSLINEGTIHIHNTSSRGLNVRNIVNSGTIQIRHVENEAVFMDGSTYRFHNLASGLLQIDNAGTGIYVRSTNALFANSGSIHIDTTTADGILVRSSGRFVNDTTGTLTMAGIGSRGINVLDNTSTVVENSGHMEIADTGENGIHASGNGAFSNMRTGTVLLHDIGGSALATTGTSLTMITNAGRIDVQLPVVQYAIDHTRRFTNSECGVFTAEKAVRSAGANFINNGFMHFGNTEVHVITASGNKIVNNGWIEDSAGLFNLATQVTNNAVLMQPVVFSGCSGIAVPGFFEIGSFNGFSISDAYTDSSFDIQAGTLDTLSNTFTPSPAGVLSTQWYFQVEDTAMGCVDTFSLEARAVCPVNCANDPYYWTGCMSADWGNPDNWNLGTQPSSIDTITIPGLPAGIYFPEILTQESIGQLHLQPGAHCTIKTEGVLQVED